ncbi:MAG: ABC transporter ATP-binding protein [Hyphomicrobiales bacterium]
MAYLSLEHLQKSFGQTQVVKDFSLDIEKGEFISLLGPSGCGKTTVLRMVAGFETPSAGAIHLDGKDIVPARPNERNIGMMFQSYALFPNLTVAGNIGFGLKVAGMSREEVEARVKSMLQMIGLPNLAESYPFELSGGQQQRVALARALAVQPRVLLLDEPLSALDAKIRVSLRKEIRDIQRDLGITTIFVTHDQEEALSISDRIVVMNKGQAEQVGAPHEIYNKPATAFVAHFVGTLNTLQAEVKNTRTSEVAIGEDVIKVPQIQNVPAENRVVFGLRPESLHLGKQKAPFVNLPAKVEDVQFLGSVIRMRMRVGDNLVSVDSFNRTAQTPLVIGSKTHVSLNPADLIVFKDEI